MSGSVRDPDESSVQGCARRLFSGSNTRGHCGRRFTRERYVDIVDAEYGRRPLRMSPNCEGGRKVIALLSIGPDVRTYTVAIAHLAIHERDDAISLALWCSEPNRILRVLEHWRVPEPLVDLP